MTNVNRDLNFYYYISERLTLEGETENMGACTKERKGITAEVLRYSWPLPALSHWEVKVGGASMEEMWGAGFAVSG